MHHRGGTLRLHRWSHGEPADAVLLGPDRSTAVVPCDVWQAAEVVDGDWVWVSCVVAPPFAFEHFELAGSDLPVPAHLTHLLPTET
jgi:predicted cupin superfamily sugar epimerase